MDLVDWLLSADARPLLATDLFAGLAERLVEDGIPLWRIATGLLTQHPEVAVVVISWTPDGGIQSRDVPHATLQAELEHSPIRTLRQDGLDRLRIRLDRPSDYPLLERFRQEGTTDYLLLRLPGQRDQIVSFTTRHPGGFTDAHLDVFEELRMPLSVRLELSMVRHVNTSLLRAYLGRNVAQRVMDGAYRRAIGERMQAIVFTCDLRGFTHRVDHRPLEEVLLDLDQYFECVTDPWMARGGEIIKFVGDAVLGILPVEDAVDDARRAIEAASESFARLKATSAALPEGRLPLQMGYVLHAGELVYGNIGSRNRVDFTVIGPVVNEASRMEKLTKELAPLVLSDAFVELLGPDHDLRPLGEHSLRGVGRALELYTTPG